MTHAHIPLVIAVQGYLQQQIDAGAFSEDLGNDFFPLGFQVQRANVPLDKLEESNELVIVCYPGERSTIETNRGGTVRSYGVQIAVMEHIDLASESDQDAAELQREDELVTLAELIDDALEMTVFEDPEASWNGNEGAAGNFPLLPAALIEWGQFSSVVTANYTLNF